MTFEDIRQDIYVANITAGRLWKGRPNFVNDSGPVSASTIQARVEFRETPGSPVLISAATSGGGDADGTITISLLGTDASGNPRYEALIHFSDTVTQEKLAAVATPADTRGQVGWGDLKVWAPSVDSGEAADCGLIQLRVDAEYTA